MTEDELKKRTKRFALRILKLVAALPKTVAGRTIGGQLVRSGTSVPANYRAACRARSKAEFISRLGAVEEEADESALWLELIMEGALMKKTRVEPLWKEADELVAIMTSSRKSASSSLASETNRKRARVSQTSIANLKSKI
ncbi:MAG: four helix bundle protein [Acidobacteria bacterium 13_1_40CM_3_55_6]|nr:MAG: four helix bundle protein [Acidobacteria bacterium 13_1_40CM_3_55_6]